MSERVDLHEFIGGFVVEAEELLGIANTCLLEIDAAITVGTSKPKAVRELFRALHTIKGLAGMVGSSASSNRFLEHGIRIASRRSFQISCPTRSNTAVPMHRSSLEFARRRR